MKDGARANSRAGLFDRGLPEPRWRRYRVCCVYRTAATAEGFALNIVTRIPEMAPIWGVSNSPHLAHASRQGLEPAPYGVRPETSLLL